MNHLKIIEQLHGERRRFKKKTIFDTEEGFPISTFINLFYMTTCKPILHDDARFIRTPVKII